MEEIRIIQKVCSLYTLSITIVEVLRLDDKWKIKLCSDITELNKTTIKDTGLLPNFCMIFDKYSLYHHGYDSRILASESSKRKHI